MRAALGFLLALALAALPIGAAAEPAPRTLRCSGIGAPTLRQAAENVAVARAAAERRAKRAARQACRAAARSLRLGSGEEAAVVLDRDPALAEELESALRRARVAGAPRYFADGGVALELEIAVGDRLDVLLRRPPDP